ncbi:MAG: hypothetical protein RRZ24_04015 [Clostridia bacterium]
MKNTTANKAYTNAMPAASAMFACAAATSSILILRTLSISLSVLLILVAVLCGILISLALVRHTPHRNKAVS